ncbi:MAG: two-component system sensor histidine kinase NtrB [Vicinamibacteraceae bacterium]
MPGLVDAKAPPDGIDAPKSASSDVGVVKTLSSRAAELVRRVRWRRLLWVAILAGTFWLDLHTPVGWNVPAVSITAILFAGWHGRRDAWIATIAATLLAALGVILSPPGGNLIAGLFNRVMDTGIFWGTLVVVLRSRNAAAKLQRSVRDLSEFKYALDQSSIVATTDRRGRITYVNDKFCEISKYAREELLGEDHRIINSSHHSKAFMKELWRTIGTGYVWHAEIKNRAKDGTYYWVDTTIIPFLDNRGKPYQYLAIRTDITGRKEAEERLREQDALSRLGQMTAVVAHEVKNPLAGILGSLQIVRARLTQVGQDVEVFDLMEARLKALNEMVDDMLKFARPKRPSFANVDIERLLRETALLLRTSEQHANVTIDIQGDEDVVVRADSEQLQQAFLNLFVNAAQAISEDGLVQVSARAHEDHVRVTIIDHGEGVPPENRERLFEPFFTTKTRGTGLGLAIVKRILERHGGVIDLTFPDEGGTTVEVTLPQVPPG